MKSNTTQDNKMIPYGRQQIDQADLDAVLDALKSDWLTTGPKVDAFERDVANVAGVRFGGAVNSGTAALHAAMYAIGIGPGDEVIVPPITFAATANAVVYQGGAPVFADVDPDTLLIDPTKVQEKITSKTRAVIAVDYAGQACDYDELNIICKKNGLHLISDACHAIGGKYKDRPLGSCADMTVFSFHPVKHITTGEGGMVVTDSQALIDKVKLFRNHGITADSHQRRENGSWYYEIHEPGYNYRLTDFQCALGMAQLKKLTGWIEKRNQIAKQYDDFFANSDVIAPLVTKDYNLHAYHIYVVKIDFKKIKRTRQEIFSFLQQNNVGVNVHYIPVHYHPFYKRHFHTGPGLCPVAESAYERILTIPLFPSMSRKQIDRVCHSLERAVRN